MKRGFHLTRGPRDAPDEVRREIELHLELRAREFEAQGMSPEAARRAALEPFGDRSAIESEVSEMRGTTLRERGRRDRLGELAQDVRIALRGLARAPGFTAVALLTLAIGIGANSAIFGVVRSVLLRPLPYPGADRLGQLWSGHRAKGRAEPEWLTPPQFVDWQAGNRTFAAMAGYQRWAPDLTGSGEPESLNGYAVSWNFLDVLGVNVARGRGFQAGDDDAGAERVVILSDELWRRRFAADIAVLGRVIQLNSEPWTVIGVLPPSFRSPVPSDVWRPTRRPATSGCGRGCVVVRAIGRLKPGGPVAAAKAALDAIQRRLGQEYPETDARVGAWPIALHEQLTGPAKPGLLALSGALLFVLLIGCVNLANLLLLRGASRAREMSVRAALGAGRGRLLRQLLTESLVLAAAGGAAGLALGWWGTGLLRAVVPPTIRAGQGIRLDGGAIAFPAGLPLAAGLLFGLVPALHAARPDLMTALRTGREGGRRGHLLRDGLVVAELALAVVLLVGAGLLGRSFLAMQRVDLGYRTNSVVVASVFFPKARYADPARALVAENAILARLRHSPAVRGDAPAPAAGRGGAGHARQPGGRAAPRREAVRHLVSGGQCGLYPADGDAAGERPDLHARRPHGRGAGRDRERGGGAPDVEGQEPDRPPAAGRRAGAHHRGRRGDRQARRPQSAGQGGALLPAGPVPRPGRLGDDRAAAGRGVGGGRHARGAGRGGPRRGAHRRRHHGGAGGADGGAAPALRAAGRDLRRGGGRPRGSWRLRGHGLRGGAAPAGDRP